MTVGALVLAGVLLALFVRERELVTLLLLAGGIGFVMIIAGSSINLIVQTRTPDHLRGRVNSLFNLLVDGGTPTGALLLGVVATAAGVDQALTIACLTLSAVAVWVGLRPAVGRAPSAKSPAASEAPMVTET